MDVETAPDNAPGEGAAIATAAAPPQEKDAPPAPQEDTAAPKQVDVEVAAEKDANTGKEDYLKQPTPLTWAYVKACYACVGKMWGMIIVLLCIWCVPLWLPSRFLQTDVTYSMQEFRDACLANAAAFEAPELLPLEIGRWTLFTILQSGLTFMLRIELLNPSGDEKEMRIVRMIRYRWAVPQLIFMCMHGALRIRYAGGADIRVTYPGIWNLAVCCTMCGLILMAISMVRQGCYVKRPWFGSKCAAVLASLVLIFITVVNLLVIVFAAEVLQMGGSQAQIALILMSNLFELACKHIFANSGMDSGLFLVFNGLVSICFVLPIRFYTFMKPDFAAIIEANLVSFIMAAMGQGWNFVWFTFQRRCLKTVPPPKYQEIIDLQGLNQLFLSHACNICAFVVILSASTKYFTFAPGVETNYQLDAALVGTSVAVSTFFEILHDLIAFKAQRAQVNTDVVKAIASSRIQRVIVPFFVLNIVTGTFFSTRVRNACLVCGAEDFCA